MKNRIVLFSIFLLICLWLSACQAKPVSSPTPEATAAPTLSAIDAALEQVDQLEAQQDYDGALTLLANLRADDPGYVAEHAGELDERAAELYLGWGNQLRASAHYLAALEKYNLTTDLVVPAALRTQIEQETQQANDLLAADNGEDGQALLEAAMAEACYQEIQPTNPLVGSTIPAGEPGRILVCDYTEAYKNIVVSPGLDAQLVQNMLAAQAGTGWLPDDLTAGTPGGARFALSRLDTYDTVTTCNYKNDQGLTDQIGVMRQQSIVMIRDMFSGEILGEKTFNGADPSYHCPPTKIYDVNNFTFGQLVDYEKIIAWLRQVLADYSN